MLLLVVVFTVEQLSRMVSMSLKWVETIATLSTAAFISHIIKSWRIAPAHHVRVQRLMALVVDHGYEPFLLARRPRVREPSPAAALRARQQRRRS